MKQDSFLRSLLFAVLTIVLSVGILYAIYEVRSLLQPVLTALLVAYLLYPIVRVGQRFSVPRSITVTLIVLLMIAAAIVSVSSLVPAITSEISKFAANARRPDAAPPRLTLGTEAPLEVLPEGTLPEVPGEDGRLDVEVDSDPTTVASSRLIQIVKDLSQKLVDLSILPEPWEPDLITEKIMLQITREFTDLLAMGASIAATSGQFLMIFFFVLVFSLMDGDKFYRSLVRMIPNRIFEPGLFILRKTIDMWGYYLRGLVVENFILGIIAVILLTILSTFTTLTVTLALAIAVIISVTNVIRIIGPFLGAIIGVILVLSQSTDYTAIIGVLAIASVVQLLDSMLILPIVMREQVNVHPVVCLLGVFMGGMVAGVMGMILAIPVIGGVLVIYRVTTVDMKRFNMQPES